MCKILIEALVLSASLTVALPQQSLAIDAGSALPISAASQQRLSTAKFGTVIPIATVGASQGLFAELEKHINPDTTAIVIESGTFSLTELAAAAAGKKLEGILQNRGDAFQITAPLVIWKGAELRIGKGEQLLLDGTKSALIINAGTLVVTDASIDASASSQAGNRFRPFILTVAEGGATIKSSHISNLGFGSFAEASGLSFLGRGFSLSTPNIQITDNTISNLVSLSFIKANGSVIRDNRLTDMRSSGIVVQSASNVTVLHNSMASSKSHGIRVTSRSQQVKLQYNDVTSSQGHGIFVDDGSVLVNVRDNHVEKSELSGIVIKGSGCSTVSDNLTESNKLSGIRAEGNLSVEISRNSIRKNHDGISLEEQAGAVTDIQDNVFSRNAIGIRSDGHGNLRLLANNFSAQWPRLFAGAMAGATGRYLDAHDARPNSEFIVHGEQKPAVVQLATFSAFGLAACNKMIGG
ncbi:right-handed parallel beta-helix repeat-containing protein [Agrobacterium rosae]|uniref:right-handed parallel beta-helix repeat-containing protein n=1 Tax=Agrobacterium rosae TaxID=1972867 RepID=UPI003BA0FBEA